MNIFDTAAVTAFIARLRQRQDADTTYYRLVITRWVRWLSSLKEKWNDSEPGRESE